MTDQEAVERVAKAIYEDQECQGFPEHPLVQAPWLSLAQAVLTAYHEYLKERNLKILPREPTEAMLDAADRNAEPDGIWFDMWSAAPEEPPQT